MVGVGGGQGEGIRSVCIWFLPTPKPPLPEKEENLNCLVESKCPSIDTLKK